MRHICFEEEKGRSRHQQAWRTPGRRGPAGPVLSCTCGSYQRGMHLDELCHLARHSAPGHAPTEMHTCREKGTFIQGCWDCKLVQALQKSAGRILKKLKINLPNDQAIPLSGICPENSPSYSTDACSVTLTAALFTIVRKWKQTKNVLHPMNGW